MNRNFKEILIDLFGILACTTLFILAVLFLLIIGLLS